MLCGWCGSYTGASIATAAHRSLYDRFSDSIAGRSTCRPLASIVPNRLMAFVMWVAALSNCRFSSFFIDDSDCSGGGGGGGGNSPGGGGRGRNADSAGGLFSSTESASALSLPIAESDVDCGGGASSNSSLTASFRPDATENCGDSSSSDSV